MFNFRLEKMSDGGYCGDTGDCCDYTGGGCDDGIQLNYNLFASRFFNTIVTSKIIISLI